MRCPLPVGQVMPLPAARRKGSPFPCPARRARKGRSSGERDDPRPPDRPRVTTSHWGAFRGGDRRRPHRRGATLFARPLAAGHPPRSCPRPFHHPAASRAPRSGARGLPPATARAGAMANTSRRPGDEALDIAAQEIDRVRKTYGNGAILWRVLWLGLGGAVPPCAKARPPLSQRHRWLCRQLRQLIRPAARNPSSRMSSARTS